MSKKCCINITYKLSNRFQKFLKHYNDDYHCLNVSYFLSVQHPRRCKSDKCFIITFSLRLLVFETCNLSGYNEFVNVHYEQVFKNREKWAKIRLTLKLQNWSKRLSLKGGWWTEFTNPLHFICFSQAGGSKWVRMNIFSFIQ